MPERAGIPRADSQTLAPTDPVAKVGDYKSIAAQYAKAKALKEKEDAAAVKKTLGAGKPIALATGGAVANGSLTDVEKLNKKKEKGFKHAWNWHLGFFVWML
jgi:phosphatidylinositol glycan class O